MARSKGVTHKDAERFIAQRRHASYVRMLRRMVESGINDSTASPSILADAEVAYTRLYGEVA